MLGRFGRGKNQQEPDVGRDFGPHVSEGRLLTIKACLFDNFVDVICSTRDVGAREYVCLRWNVPIQSLKSFESYRPQVS